MIRALRPHAEAVDAVIGGTSFSLEHLAHGVWGALVPYRDLIDYRLSTTWPGGHNDVSADGYRFLPTLGELDLHLFGEGRHERLWEILGAHRRRYDTPDGDVTGTSFAVWAPNARGVSVIGDFDGWSGRNYPMRVLGSTGVWELFVPDIEAGDLYKFRVHGADGSVRDKADPHGLRDRGPARDRVRCRSSTTNGTTPSGWPSARRAEPAQSPMSVYEVHLGSWRPGLELPRTRRRTRRPRHRDGIHPRRIAAGRRAPVRRFLGVPGHVVLRADLAVRLPRRLPVVRRPSARTPASGSSSTGFPRTSPRTSGRWPASTAPRSTSTATPSVASNSTGVHTCSISGAARSATFSSRTRCTGSTSSTSTVCASTRSPRCCTSTIRGRRAAGRRTSTAAGRTSRPSRSCRR